MPMKESELKLFEPVALAIGKSVTEWNQMCESLGSLFARILYPGMPIPEIAWAVWHSTTNDKAQRDMLLAASIAAKVEINKSYPKFGDDVAWLSKRGNALADKRNIVVHAPLNFELDRQNPTVPLQVIPDSFFGHPRAIRLEGKNLINEFELCASYAELLKFFARRIDNVLTFGMTDERPWPDRPKLPSLGENGN